MGRLSGYRYREIIKILKRFGFEFHRQAAGSHVMKPSFGCYIDNNQRLSAQISLSHIFENDDAGNKPFGYINLGLIFRIF